jgi:hypothetical protein
MRFPSACLIRCLALGALPAAAEERASTIRVEPHGYYGAVVTVEAGVRVFRPLPPHRLVVMSPEGTPVNLSINETEKRTYHDRGRRPRD